MKSYDNLCPLLEKVYSSPIWIPRPDVAGLRAILWYCLWEYRNQDHKNWFAAVWWLGGWGCNELATLFIVFVVSGLLLVINPWRSCRHARFSDVMYTRFLISPPLTRKLWYRAGLLDVKEVQISKVRLCVDFPEKSPIRNLAARHVMYVLNICTSL